MLIGIKTTVAQGTVLCVNWHKNNRDPLCENSDPLWVWKRPPLQKSDPPRVKNEPPGVAAFQNYGVFSYIRLRRAKFAPQAKLAHAS